MSNKPLTIEVWCCPHPECSDYYAAANTHGVDLASRMNSPAVDNVAEHEKKHGTRFTHSRAQCPACKTSRRGEVDRVRVTTTILVPVPESVISGNAT